MKPYIVALERCILLLGQCRQAEVSLCIRNDQLAQMKPRSVQNRVHHNLTHQLANDLSQDAEISRQPALDDGEDTQFTLRTVVMKAGTYLDLHQGLNVLLAAALEQDYDDEPDIIVDDRQYDMFPS